MVVDEKGNGVAGAEAANNAVNGPTMVPLLTLGPIAVDLKIVRILFFSSLRLKRSPTKLATRDTRSVPPNFTTAFI